LPSIVTGAGDAEGIPVTLIEAMSCRVPVVTTATGGIPELFEGVEDAPLVPPKDPTALADFIEKFVKDSKLRDRLADSGRRRVEENFTIEQVVEELIKRFETSR
jgi:glycosyltransferase involved in cell wall biosynthesis